MSRRPFGVFFVFLAGLILCATLGAPTRAEAIGDTLTVIQRPLVNIPSIVTSGSNFTIECDAGPGTTGWGAELIYRQTHVPLSITGSTYNSSTEWWELEAAVPPVSLYELYDLEVTANGGISDLTKNAVRVIPAFKNDYYFVHVTDPHMPTHLYYYESGSDTDSSEVVDFREVIHDINIINPEFVLLTGDYINEGELEEFLNKQYYTRCQALLYEFDVPVYLTSGNHDLGGWDDTPPPDGTARRDWWRFFGWKRLDSPPPGAPWYTQNYSFDYGPVHYIGLEAYINYDGWRYSTYGGESFTSGQMQWLADDMAASSESAAHVLFYHYDFSNQVNLNSLGADMSLAGHTHRDDDDFSHPYEIITDNVCDGARSYRLVRVSGGSLTPSYTTSAGSNGNNLMVTYAPANDGTNYTVTASITKSMSEDFEHAQLRFAMPNEAGTIDVTGGTLLQTDYSGTYAVCYVAVDISSPSQSVTITLDPAAPEPPTVAVDSPNGGETWYVDSFFDIMWTADDDVGVAGIDILLSTDGGSTFPHTIATGEPDDGLYSWQVDVTPTTEARVKVVAWDGEMLSGEDVSDADFTIADGTSPEVSVDAPNGGEVWDIGLSYDVTWTANDNIGVTSIDILLSSDGGSSYPDTIAAGEADDGIYSWLVDAAATVAARIKVVAYDAASNSNEDVSDSDFEIYDPTSGVGPEREVPERALISGNMPNPFSAHTVIRFGVPADGWVDLGVYDVSGRLVARVSEGRYAAGYHEVAWKTGGVVPPGVYFVRLDFGPAAATRKIVISR
jgi:predicted MPP superfamily phosphohydrolase